MKEGPEFEVFAAERIVRGAMMFGANPKTEGVISMPLRSGGT